eukprot:jgi/Chlat1/6229/Chrsp44S05815
MARGMSAALLVVFALLAVQQHALVAAAEEEGFTTVLTPDNFDDLVGQDKPALIECGHCKKLAPEYESLAQVFSKTGKVVIGKVDCDSHKDLCGKFDVKGYPTIKWFNKDSSKPDDYNSGRTADDLVAFVNGKIGTNLKVKKAPTAVTVLTDATFDAIVKDPTKDVLVEFYAPWCGHCKSLAPEYEKVAATFAADEDVVIANLDADNFRDIGTKYGVEGFPTIKFFPKDNKEGEDYAGGRTPQDFIKFINERAGTQRVLGGGLTSEAGRLADLDTVVKEFLSAAESARESIIEQAEKAVAALSGKTKTSGDYYVKVMRNIVKKGATYASTEAERLERMLAGNLTPLKSSEFSLRKNILAAFSSSE